MNQTQELIRFFRKQKNIQRDALLSKMYKNIEQLLKAIQNPNKTPSNNNLNVYRLTHLHPIRLPEPHAIRGFIDRDAELTAKHDGLVTMAVFNLINCT